MLILGFVGRFVDATPTAELEPFSDSYVQSDEVTPDIQYCQQMTIILRFFRLLRFTGGHGHVICRIICLWTAEKTDEARPCGDVWPLGSRRILE